MCSNNLNSLLIKPKRTMSSKKNLCLMVYVFTIASSIMMPDLIEQEVFKSITLHPSIDNFFPDFEIVDEEWFEASIDCIVEFLHEYFYNPHRTVLWIPSKLMYQDPNTEYFISELTRKNISLYVSLEIPRFVLNCNISYNTLIFIQNSLELENMSSNYLYACQDRIYVIIIRDNFFDESSFLQEADNLYNIMWAHWISRVIILGKVNETIFSTESISYVEKEPCRPSSPIVTNQCNERNWRNIIKRRTHGNLNGCTVHVSFFDSLPYASDDNETEHILGVEGYLMETILKVMNGTLLKEPILASENISFYDQLDMRLINNEAQSDFVIGGLWWNPDKDIEYTKPYETIKIAWLVPARNGVSLRGLISPLANNVWIAICVLLLCGVAIRLFITKDIAFLDIFSILFSVAVPKQPRKTFSRIHFMSWVIFGFLLTQFYLGSLAGQLMTNNSSFLYSMKELLEAGFTLGGTSYSKKFFSMIDEDDDDVDEDVIFETISNRFVIFSHYEFNDKLADLLSGREDSLALVIETNVSSVWSSFGNNYVYMLEENMGKYPLAMAVWRGLTYLEEFNHNAQRMIQGGLIKHYTEMILLEDQHRQSRENNVEIVYLGLTQLIPGFILLSIGYALGLIAFCFEFILQSTKIQNQVRKMKFRAKKRRKFKFGKKNKRIVVGSIDEYRKPERDYCKIMEDFVQKNRRNEMKH